MRSSAGGGLEAIFDNARWSNHVIAVMEEGKLRKDFCVSRAVLAVESQRFDYQFFGPCTFIVLLYF